jgi:hypothetical protein
MLKTVQGIYRNGKVELLETPQGISESKVSVTFLPPESVNAPSHLMSFGMFAGGQQSTETDFKDAEFKGNDISKPTYHICRISPVKLIVIDYCFFL